MTALSEYGAKHVKHAPEAEHVAQGAVQTTQEVALARVYPVRHDAQFPVAEQTAQP